MLRLLQAQLPTKDHNAERQSSATRGSDITHLQATSVYVLPHLVEGELDGEAADAVGVDGVRQLQRRSAGDPLCRIARARKLRKLLLCQGAPQSRSLPLE